MCVMAVTEWSTEINSSDYMRVAHDCLCQNCCLECTPGETLEMFEKELVCAKYVKLFDSA